MITYINSKEQVLKVISINKINSSLNELVFQSKEFSSKETTTSLLEVLAWAKLLPKSIKKYFAIDIIPFNKDIEKIRGLLSTLAENGFYGVRTEDLSILNMLEESEINLKVILDSTTGGNNINYYNFFSRFKSIKRVVLSRELAIEKILTYAQNAKVKLELQSYGLLQIFHTKRKLIESMEENVDKSIPKLLYLKEPKRDDESFPLLETSDGTFMFHSKILNFEKYKTELLKFNINQLIDLRHIQDINHYEQILSHFLDINNYNLSEIESLPFLEVLHLDKNEESKETKSYLTDNKARTDSLEKVGTVLDSVKGKELILRSDIKLELGMELFFFNNKKKELNCTIKYISEFGDSIYVIPWRKGVSSNSAFYIKNKK